MKRRILFLALLGIGMAACKKTEDHHPKLEVNLNSTTYKVGDTVSFQLSGNADHVVFYSGETNHEYQHRNRTSIAGGDVYLSFSSRVQNGTQPDQVRVLLSSEFAGAYNITDIRKADWRDVTDRFTLATGNTAIGAGNVKVTDLIRPDRPSYIAVKYTTKNQTLSGTQRNWFLTLMRLTRQTATSPELLLGDQAAMGFQVFSFGNKEAARTTASSTTLTLRGNTTDLVSETEDWAVSKAFYPLAVSPDQGVAIKNYAANTLTSYDYVFTAPGSYKVSFVGRNQTIKGEGEVLRELNVVVNP